MLDNTPARHVLCKITLRNYSIRSLNNPETGRYRDKAILLIPATRNGREGRIKMAENKKKDVFVLPRKVYWHLYSLQSLSGEKFIKVVNKILNKDFQLIK